MIACLLDIMASMSPDARKNALFIDNISKIDSISNYSDFRKTMMTAKSNPSVTLPRFHRYGYESLIHYGYYHEIMKYADLDPLSFPYLNVEHGIYFNSSSTWVNGRILHESIGCACQGSGRCTKIYSIDSWKPVFVLGPYIHYASDYYDKEEFDRIKGKLGRVLLIFPAHTCETSNQSYSIADNFFETIYKKYASKFSTIFVCSYWNDIDSLIIRKFEENGAVLVSAGFRGDPNFVRRLRTIISLSDAVVVDDIGTNIGYCIYLGKPIYLECSAVCISNDPAYKENFNRFHEAFYSPDMNFTPLQYKQQNELYEFFWGGDINCTPCQGHFEFV